MSGAPQRAFVLGGGIAGIAAAFELVDRGYETELLEARKHLGGRVFSFDDRVLSDRLDNGPHVMLGCYDHFRRLLRRLGTEGDFVQPPALRMVYRAPGGGRDVLELSRWPTPLALPWGVLRMSGLRGARLRAMRGLVSSLLGAPRDWTFGRWLAARRQDGAPRRYLWEPLCLSIMNAAPDEVSADLFLRTLKQAFSGSAPRSAIWIPRRPWSAILGDAAHEALTRAGARVTVGFQARSLRMVDGHVSAIGGRDGVERTVGPQDVVVSALPWHRAARLLPSIPAAGGFQGRPIVNVYFDVDDDDAPPHDGELTILVDGDPFQVLYRRPGARAGRFALIASAAGSLDGLPIETIAERARKTVADYYPATPVPDSAAIRVTKEPLATLLPGPDDCRDRPAPGQCPDVANLFVCGDWTQTHLPSTLEGAAASAALMGDALERR